MAYKILVLSAFLAVAVRLPAPSAQSVRVRINSR